MADIISYPIKNVIMNLGLMTIIYLSKLYSGNACLALGSNYGYCILIRYMFLRDTNFMFKLKLQYCITNFSTLGKKDFNI